MTADYRVAIHEAGHAWAAYLLGSDVLELSLLPNQALDADAYCMHAAPVERDGDHHARAQVLLAGMAAEGLYLGDTDLIKLASNGGFHDFQGAALVTGCNLVRQGRKWRFHSSTRFQCAWDAARALATEHFPRIARLATFLMRHPRMRHCSMPAIRHIERGKDMREWQFCAFCGVRLPAESEVDA